MKKPVLFFLILFTLTLLTEAATIDSLVYGSFGKVYLYKPKNDPDAFVIFVGDATSWKKGLIDLGLNLADQGAMVVNISSTHYFSNKKIQHEKCCYPAGDLEELSMYLQKKYRFRAYFKPILVGYSSCASLVYGILAQAPANTFKGAIGLGFCPELPATPPLCSTNQLKMHVLKPGSPAFILEPGSSITAPFIVINGSGEKRCGTDIVQRFVNEIHEGECILIPEAGKGTSLQKMYLSKLLYAYQKVKSSASYADIAVSMQQSQASVKTEKLVTAMTLVEKPVNKTDTLPLLIFISGDGGWTSFDDGVSLSLTKRGIPVVGIDAQKYFWQARTPDETASELVKVIHHYMADWNKKSFVLCGYSFGADIIPFMVTRLPADLTHALKGAIMMSPDPKGDFEIHVSDMLSLGNSHDTYNVLAEARKITNSQITCFFGEEEGEDMPKLFKNDGIKTVLLPGSHHYGNNFNAVSAEIVKSISK